MNNSSALTWSSWDNYAPQYYGQEQPYYYNPEALTEVRKEVITNPQIEIGFNTYGNIQEYAEALDFGIYTFHTRGEVLNTKGFECLEKLEKNASIHAALTNFKLSVIQPKLKVVAADNCKESELLKDFVEYLLANMDSNITTILFDILSAVTPGYSISEKVYKFGKFHGETKKIIKAIKVKKPGLYAFFIDAFDNIQAVRSLINYGQALPKEKFVIYSFLSKNSNPYGFPLFDVLYPYFFALNELQKFMVIGAAKYANPSLVVYTPNGASTELISAVQDFVEDITTSSVGTLPESVKTQILDITGRGGNPYLNLLNYFISEIEKAILLNDLTISQSKDTGTRAESTVKQEQGKMPIIRFIRRQLEEVLKEQLIKPLIAYNFDPEKFPAEKYPSLIFNDIEKESKTEFVKNVVELTKEGYMSAVEHGEFVRESVFDNIPKADDLDSDEYVDYPDFRLPKEKAIDELENSTIPDYQIQEADQNYGYPTQPNPTESQYEEVELHANYAEAEEAEEAEVIEYKEDITNYPKQGDNKKISLKNSNHKQFPYEWAMKLKDEYPKIWSKGGNEYGNTAFIHWGNARDDKNTPGVLNWIRKREAWAARHKDNHRIAGVIAQVKWGVIGSRGLSYMKKLINEEKKKYK